MNDALEVLNELEVILKKFGDVEDGICYDRIADFIENQRSIYGEAKGECAS